MTIFLFMHVSLFTELFLDTQYLFFIHHRSIYKNKNIYFKIIFQESHKSVMLIALYGPWVCIISENCHLYNFQKCLRVSCIYLNEYFKGIAR